MANSFFQQPYTVPLKKQGKLNHQFLKIGEQKPFQALAIAFIDYFNSSTCVNDSVLKKILACFHLYYPQFTAHQSSLTSSERMSILMNNVRKSDMVECMAYVFRQMTVDEIYDNPLNYREVFDGLARDTSTMYLRQENTPFPINGLRALVRSLGIDIILSHVAPGKELRKREIYAYDCSSVANTTLHMQVNDTHFLPRVIHAADFSYVGQLAIKPPKPAAVNDKYPDTIAPYIDLIANDNQRLLRVYTQWRQNLITMVDVNELTTPMLMTMHIKFLPLQEQDNRLLNSKQFFSRLVGSGRGILIDKDLSRAKYINEELAGSLAEWISLDLIDPDYILDYFEKPSTRVSSSAACP